ncbi:MAG TPA: ATP-binding protein [Candidatus Nanopelagicales bacterium]
MGVAAALSGVLYLAWRWATPSECAWVGPDAAQWLPAGVLPTVTDVCPLRPGSTVTGAQVAGSTVQLLRGPADPVLLPLEASGPLVLQRLLGAAASLAFCGGFFALALFAALRRRADRSAGATAIMSGALLGSTIVTMVGLPAHQSFDGPARWAFMLLTQPLFLLAWGAGLAWLLLFPTPLGIARRFDLLWVAAIVGPALAWAAVVTLLALTLDSATGWMRASILVQSGITVAVLVSTLALLVVRLSAALRAEPGSVPRQQLLWVAGSAVAAGLLTLSLWLVPQLLTGRAMLPGEVIGAPGLLFVAGFGIAMARHRMFDLDPLLARTLVYLGLTLAAVLVCLATSALLAAGLGTVAPARTAAVGAVIAALVVSPLRVRLGHWVNQAFYGDRDDPYAALSRVAAAVAARGVADGAAAEDIRRALRAPCVRIECPDGRVVLAGDSAAVAAGTVDVPLGRPGQATGRLQVAVRTPGDQYSPGERRLLDDIAGQISAALHEQSLAGELQLSRERIVTAREEERRALRRALHDEVGPTMASVSLRAETARRLLHGGPDSRAAADPVLAAICADASAAAESLRAMAYDLRPPALDELGLARALATRAAPPDLQVTVSDTTLDQPGRPPLSAAVEAALYRIAAAALDNAARHGRARQATITLTKSDKQVQMVITDDGLGLPPDATPGVGITSMRERAAELGGTCTVTSGSPGTIVRADLPTGGPPGGRT